jgi:hypothetical protein
MKPRFFRYCKNCKFYELYTSDWGSDETCHHPANITHGQSHSGPTMTHIYKPSVKNKDARCADYVENTSPKSKFRAALKRWWA